MAKNNSLCNTPMVLNKHSQPLRCLLTGAHGFIGAALTPHLRAHGHKILPWPRTTVFNLANSSSTANKIWVQHLQNIDVVVHLAGLAHQPSETENTARYFEINRDGTLSLANAAQAAGVKRFIFLSSAKVFGEGGDTIYGPTTPPNPQGAYAESKWQAEQLLMEKFARTMDIVILRPPLVYGPQAKANFGSLLKYARLPIPLPLGGIDNRRSLIGLDNLLDLITVCLSHPAAAGKTWLCADTQPYSLADIIASIRRSANRSPNLIYLPKPILAILKRILGSAISDRLFNNFQMDCRETYNNLDWEPPFTMEQTLRRNLRGRQA